MTEDSANRRADEPPWVTADSDTGDTDEDDQAAAALTAACAQVEMWMEMGEDSAWRGPLSSRTVGRVSETFAAGGGGTTSLAPRAHRALMLAGLLYRGAGIR